MSNKDLARRAQIDVSFAGVNITSSIKKYFKSLTFTDNEEDDPDDLEIQLADKDNIWLTQWLNDIESAAVAATPGLKIKASIIAENWKSDGTDKAFNCGTFELDDLGGKGPPSTIVIKGTSLPYGSQIRQTKKSKAWESQKLSRIAKEIASKNKMKLMYLSSNDPFYKRVEQTRTADIKFLSKLCRNAGISLKVTNNTLVLFDQAAYEAKNPVFTFKFGDKTYGKWDVHSGEAETKYDSCQVKYVNPSTGKVIKAIAYTKDYDAKKKDNQQLNITAKVSNTAEAKTLAEKKLRQYNKYQKTGSLTMPGNPDMMAGITIMLTGWGMWSGKYIIKKAVHTVGNNGYTTQIHFRRVLEGY